MSATQGSVLYDNAARDTGVTIAYSGTDVAGKEYQNSYDWRDFSLFTIEQNETNTQLDITLATGRDIDCAAVFVAPLPSGTGTIELFYESAPAVFTSLATFTASTTEGLVEVDDFTAVTVAAGRKIRWQFNTGATNRMNIRQLVVGERLDFPIGQRDGLQPPSLNGDIQTDTVISVNGSVIGRSIRRIDRPSEIMLEYLTEAFVRGDWQTFTTHAIKYAFFYRHDRLNWPDEATFATATSIPRPTNSMPPPLMAVSLPLKNLVNSDNL